MQKIWGLVGAILLASCVSVVGCKKTEKGENSRWESGLRTISNLAATYPGFKTALEEQRATAEKAMEAAREVSDDEARIEAMSSANTILTGGFVRKLDEADHRSKKLRKDLVELAGKAQTPEEKNMLREAKRQAEKSLSEVDRTLRSGASSASDANAVLAKVDSELDFADKALDSVRKQVSSRKSDEAAAKKAETDKAAAKQAADKAAVADWTCEFCDHKNPHDATKCSNCGAARPK